MKKATINVLLFVHALAILVTFAAANAGQGEGMKIYMPREATVEAGTVALGKICVIRCDDEQALAKASAVTLGRSPFSREKLKLDRATILARLGSGGVDTSGVKFAGADVVVLQLNEQEADGGRLVAAAQEFLEKNHPGPAGCAWRLLGKQPQLMIPNRDDVLLKPRLEKSVDERQIKLTIAAVSGSSELASVDMTFQIVYPVQQSVAVKDIPPGTMIGVEHFKVETVMAEEKAGNWVSPVGLMATQPISAGGVISPSTLRPVKAEVVVRRDQNVTMRIQGLGFTLIGTGTAMENGRPGDFIKVKNVDSQRIVICKVAPDASVEPSYEEVR